MAEEEVLIPMLIAYRRHTKRCPHRGEGRKYRHCRCPIWVDGWLNGAEIRESLKLRDWEKAQEKIRDWEAEGKHPEEPKEETTIKKACQEFIQDAEARNLREPTLAKYHVLFRHLQEFAAQHGLRYITELDLNRLRKFRAAWPDHNISALKKLERLRAFCRFAHEVGWISANPAAKIKNPKVTDPPTMPFTKEEMVEILAACDKYPDNYGHTRRANGRRLRALVLLLRYSGLRIRDAVTLPRDRIANGKLFLYTAKTGVPVYCPLPPFVTDALAVVERSSEAFYFWTGESNPKSAVGDWQRSLSKLFALTKITRGHAHRFRDTFAVELLLAGVPLERVSVLLGHKSTKVTEKHYTPWVRARQEQVEADVMRTWKADPLLAGGTWGTPEVHGEGEVVN